MENGTDTSSTITHPIVYDVPKVIYPPTKMPEPVTLGACGVFGDPRSELSCPQEINLEQYCLRVNHTAFCKTVGDLYDADGFIKPEHPYCTTD